MQPGEMLGSVSLFKQIRRMRTEDEPGAAEEHIRGEEDQWVYGSLILPLTLSSQYFKFIRMINLFIYSKIIL